MKCEVSKHILIFAMRYALGRLTSAPSMVIENIKDNIDCFTTLEKKSMVDEIRDQEGFSFGYGTEYNKDEWKNFEQWLMEN